MIALRDIFKKYTGVLRELKAVYIINNLLNYKQLQHNKALYKQYGVGKSIFSPIGSKDFVALPDARPWLDQPAARIKLKEKLESAKTTFPDATKNELERFVEEGYMILKGFFDEEAVDFHNREVEKMLAQQEVDFNFSGRKIMDAFRRSEYINQQFLRHPELLRLLGFIMGKAVIPFQTINFIVGSEQRAHSDSIHMTTHPKGYLIAIWVALEDCDANNGPLFYYPKSHRLPYIMCEDYPSGNGYFTIGKESNRRYEDCMAQLVEEQQLEPAYFHAKKGDILVWHANLLHGGSPIKKEGATRKSMVAHYFCADVICYHEMSQRPALFRANS